MSTLPPELAELLAGQNDYSPARFSYDLTTAEMREQIDFELANAAAGGRDFDLLLLREIEREILQ